MTCHQNSISGKRNALSSSSSSSKSKVESARIRPKIRKGGPKSERFRVDLLKLWSRNDHSARRSEIWLGEVHVKFVEIISEKWKTWTTSKALRLIPRPCALQRVESLAKIASVLGRRVGTRKFQPDRVITGGNYLSLLQSIAAGNAKYHSGKSAPLYRAGIATRGHKVVWERRSVGEVGGGREKKRSQSEPSRDPAAFYSLGGKRLIMRSKVRNSVILGDPSPL